MRLAERLLLGPACALGYAGAGKILAPDGVMPLVARDWIAMDAWPAILRGVGAVELLVAAGLVLPRTRRAAAWTGVGLCFAFTAIVGVSAADDAFLGGCGCLPDMAGLPGGALGHVAWIAILATLLGAGAAAAAPLRAAVVVGSLVALAGALAGEIVLRRDAERDLRALALGQQRRSALGWGLEGLQLRDAAGGIAAAPAVLGPHDFVLFVSEACVACRHHAPQWDRVAARLQRQRGRLVVVGVDDRSGPPALIPNAAAAFALHDRRDALRYGVAEVPALVALDARGRVVFHESAGRADAAPRAVQVPGACVVSSGGRGALRTWLAIERGPSGVIRAVRMLSSGPLVRLLDPDRSIYRALIGHAPAEAVALAERMSATPCLEAGIWAAAADAVRGLPDRAVAEAPR